jgi:hypothetical protein
VNALSKGNAKTGARVVTFSRTPGSGGTCPGASAWCDALVASGACYATRPYRQYAESRAQWDANARAERAPALPPPRRDGAPIKLRIHVSGDFDSAPYVRSWIAALRARPDVIAWAYTRSWRVPRLRRALEDLRALHNVQLFASIDPTIREDPPSGWRVAWISGDPRAGGPVCPEQLGRVRDCDACGICYRARRGDITFLQH